MKKKFVWEKWNDPLLSNYDEMQWPGYDLDENENKIPIHSVERQPVMHTPFGMISVVQEAFAANQFDFRILHTNFSLTEGIIKIIGKVEGVETLEPYTRYRARIGFPKSELFVTREVMNNIEEAIRNLDRQHQNQLLEELELSVAEEVIEKRNEIDKKFDYWAIWVVPNGNIEVLTSNKLDKTYKNKLSILKQTKETVGGRLIISESEQ